MRNQVDSAVEHARRARLHADVPLHRRYFVKNIFAMAPSLEFPRLTALFTNCDSTATARAGPGQLLCTTLLCSLFPRPSGL